jgi:hypothetical protein
LILQLAVNPGQSPSNESGEVGAISGSLR